MRSFFIILGFISVTLSSFFFIRYFEYKNINHNKNTVLEKILEGEEHLKRSSKRSTERAIDIFSKLKSKNIKSYYFRIRYNLAKALEKNGEYAAALKIYKNLNQLKYLNKEEKVKNNLALGNLLLRLNRKTEGRGLLQFVVVNSQSNNLRSNAFTSLGDHYFRAGNYKKARDNYKLALEENASNPRARLQLGESLRKLGKEVYYEAIYDDYMANDSYFDPDSKKVRNQYKNSIFDSGKKHFVNKKYYKAIQYFKKSLKLGLGLKKEEEAFYYIAESYRFVKNYKNSIIFFNKILINKIYSLDQTALYKKGLIAFERENYRRAASLFQKTHERNPTTPVGKLAIDWQKESIKIIEDNLSYQNDQKNNKEDFPPLVPEELPPPPSESPPSPKQILPQEESVATEEPASNNKPTDNLQSPQEESFGVEQIVEDSLGELF